MMNKAERLMRERDVEDLKERVRQFGLAIIRMTERLPAGRIAGVVANRIIKSGTSVGANYLAACRRSIECRLRFEYGHCGRGAGRDVLLA